MIVDPQLPRALWPVGKISQVFPGADGRVRAANVEVKGRTYTRIVARLILLPALPEDDWCWRVNLLLDERIQSLNSGAAVQKALIFLNVPDNPDQSECSMLPHHPVVVRKTS